MRSLGVLVVLLALVGATGNALAGEGSPWTAAMGGSGTAQEKFLYGAKNLLFGWTELLTEPDEALWTGANFFGGVFKGVWNAIGQTLGGAAQLLTFPWTGFDLPLPEGGFGWERPGQ